MALWSLVSSLLGSLASTPANNNQAAGGAYSSYIQQPKQQSMLSSMLDFSGRAQSAKSSGEGGKFAVKTLIGGDVLGLFGGSKGKEQTFDPYSIYSAQQLPSVYALQSLASDGTGAGMTLGKKYDGNLGYYNQGAQGMEAGDSLRNLMNTAYGTESDIGQARSVFQNLAKNSVFDLESDQSGYKAYSKALAKAGLVSSDVLNREAAISGNRFGTSISRDKAILAEDLQNQRAMQIANLYQSSQAMAALGAQGLTGLANQVADIAGLNITYDEYQRGLKDKIAEDQYADFARQQRENYMRLGLMNDQWQNPMGKITYKS